jgi:hypothetical protein
MRQLLLATALVSMAFVTCGTLAQAQERWWGAWPPDRVSGLVRHVHEDLNRGYHSGWRFNDHDRGRLNHAEGRLHEFAEKWHDQGRFDLHDLDHAIGDIQHVVDDNHMSGGERDALWHDLEDLRHMRDAYERHEIGRW